MTTFSLDQLRCFAEVVRCGSFSAAADVLGVTQPAISLQIRQLEKRLGVALIERVGRRTMATAAGEELLRHQQRIDAAVGDALAAMAQYRQGELGQVRLGTGATACIYLLPGVLEQLRQQWPSLQVTVNIGNTRDMLRAVEENRLDMALVTLPASGRMLDVTPWLQDELVLVACRDVALPEQASAEQLRQHSLLLYEPGGNTRRIVDAWLTEQAQEVEVSMTLGSVEAIKELVKAGLGWAIVPRMAVEAQAELHYCSLSPPLFRTLALVMRQDKSLSRGLQLMRQALSEQCREY
ncbi:LysR family transcriptional regulator [Pokkaliibacter sp. MBI-7]|uniref:LysR family transcriptional regulator n=1 Tax=Pokkaliibacter sp. MBI-7 TaxID=3040600 RepID=UPI00244B3279|nr:LysR family transcriptional regulator [Pokkaliibacter sp. MBI-7]MDH2432751.1 LysR family transcriptional regulator [Pokkaliibacter sp. MBI-7]